MMASISSMSDHVEGMQRSLSESTKDYWVSGSIPRLHNPTTVQFLREAVCSYHPVIITGLMDSWPAMSKWSQQYLTETLGNRKLSINLTPDGHGDCVKSIVLDEIAGAVPNSSNDDVSIEHFVYPAEHDMTMASFFELLEGRDANGAAVPGVVPYLSQQNDNLRQNMPELLQDIQQSLPLAVEAFSSSTGGMESGALEAVNLWIGDERSVSSIHKDHFENMYAVVSGEKTFTLLPPTDVAFLEPYVGTYPTLRYAVKSPTNAESGEKVTPSPLPLALELRNDDCPSESLEWLPLDPDHPDAEEQYPLLRQASPLRCTVRAGEVLYIPAMWYHRVSQTCLTVSVNYWYDQKFDFRFVFYQTIKNAVRGPTIDEGDSSVVAAAVENFL